MPSAYRQCFLSYIKWLALPFFLLFLLLPAALFSQNKDTPNEGPYIKIKVFVAGYGDTATLTADDVIAAGRLQPAVKGYQVTSFRLGMYEPSEGGHYYEMFNKGDTFTEMAIQQIRRASSGGRLFFDHIQATNSAGNTYSLMAYTCSIVKPAVKK